MGVLLAEPALVKADADCIVAELIDRTEPQIFIDKPAVTPRGVTETRIVCGNCGGDDPLPRETLLTMDGCCDCCGGRSYVLAINLEIARRIPVALKQQTTVLIS